MYNVSVAQITAINPDCTQMIYVGEVLRIPQNTASADYFFHTIKAGDTLYRLTVTYKVSAKDICDLNPGLDAENFQAGTVIRIPKHSAAVITTVPPARQETIKVETPKCRDMHKVKKKETVYSICKKYSLTEDELIAANPSIKTLGLQKGDVICIPYASPKQTVVAPSNQDLFSSVRSTSKMTGAIKLAVVLPFASDSRMVEYYEGLLIAVDSLKYKGVSMDIYAYDLSKENVQKLLASKPELSKMDIIIGPRDKNDIKPLADFAKEHKIRLVIPFTSKDNEAFVNPFVYQVNTPQLYLYPAVYDHFCKEFKKPYIIFIESSVKDDSKDQFIKGMKETLLRKGIPNTTISDNASLDDMTDALFSDRQNVFIPTSGTHVALIKIITKLELLVRANRNKQIALFGYPEWQTLTKEHLRQFFATNTYFYTSFYTNDLLPEAKSFERTYTKWYL
jgi:LysM repeat protein